MGCYKGLSAVVIRCNALPLKGVVRVLKTTKYSAIGQCAHWLAAVSLSVCALISGPAYTQELAPNNKPAVDSGQQAKHTISTFKDSIFQVRIINVDSKNARSFGSGFYIGDGGLIATNYHVINSVLFEPENYRAIIEIGDEEIPLNIEAVDAISDVAILSVPVKRPALALSAVPPRAASAYILWATRTT